MFRKREKTLLEKQMLDAGVDIQIGIGRHLFKELLNHGYANVKIDISLAQYLCMDGVYYTYAYISDYKNSSRVYAKSWLPYSGNTNEPAPYDRWIINIRDYPGSGLSFMIQGQYSSKYDFKGKMMVEHV